jgi:hypothetical protein
MHSSPRKVFGVACLALLSVLAPACTNSKSLQAPTLIAGIPSSNQASNVALMPNLVVQFDRDMDPAFMNSNYFVLIASGATSGVAINVEYLPALDEARIWPAQFLNTNPPVTGYTLIISGLVQSAKGTAMGSNNGFSFVTKSTNAATNLISFNTLSIVPSNGPSAGQITLTWDKATETQAGGTVDITTYDVYMSTAPGAEDLIPGLFLNGALVGPANTSGSVTATGLLSGTTYYFKVQPRDGDGNVYTSLPEVSWTAP